MLCCLIQEVVINIHICGKVIKSICYVKLPLYKNSHTFAISLTMLNEVERSFYYQAVIANGVESYLAIIVMRR